LKEIVRVRQLNTIADKRNLLADFCQSFQIDRQIFGWEAKNGVVFF